MTKIFLKTLSSFYYERMIASAPSDFTEMVNMGMRLEEGVRERHLTRDEGSSAKRYRGFAKKKEGEAHDVSSHTKRRPSVKRKTVRPASNQHQVAHIAPTFREAQHYQHQQQHQQYQQQHRPQQQAYQPRNNNNTSTSYDRKRVTFDPISMTYAELYPSLIDRKLITPSDPPAVPTNPQWWSNVKKNPLPEHGKAVVNMVQGCPGKYKVLKDIQEMLDQGMIEILQNRNEDEVDVISPVFRIPEPVVVRYDGSKKKVSPSLIIKPAGPVSYSSDKVVPYRYNAVALEDGKEVSLPSTSIVSISDVSGVTRSGRVFSAPPKPHEDVLRRATVDNFASSVGTSSSPNPALAVKGVDHVVVVKALVPVGQHGILKEDCDEMLRLIKRSEYNVRVLDVAYVDHDVTIEQFDSIVANITACNNLSFFDADLPEEGKDHNLALHISMNCKDDALSNMLVDTGSSLNMLPKSTLAKLSYQGPLMRQSGVVVKAFNGSRKTVIGEFELPIKIGPSDFHITFQVMDIHPSYSCLLGRPYAEDEVGTPFQALTIAEPSRKGLSSFASYNDAKLAIEHGATTGLGQMIKLEDNKSWAGIGLIKPIEHNDPTPSPHFEFPVFEAEEDDVEEIPNEITRLLEHEEKVIQPHLENLETVNLGSEDCIREVKIEALLEESIKKGLIELL
ncbi:hypothetical protein KIW84_074058 [Lathyrus oleraceus]|uniref:Uncharacterized protein n=1 Tax=Pisum sativum TaxID=3888 RepID=A0A9D4ZWD4_PEA|nr:hypothetical protein KIW84_074058 [Pisum sativum]